jgi:hypothetical protein
MSDKALDLIWQSNDGVWQSVARPFPDFCRHAIAQGGPFWFLKVRSTGQSFQEMEAQFGGG